MKDVFKDLLKGFIAIMLGVLLVHLIGQIYAHAMILKFLFTWEF